MSQFLELGTLNLTQSLFMLDEKLSSKNQQNSIIAYSNDDLMSPAPSAEMNNIRSTNSINSFEMLPAILNQSHMSTYYQDNPFDILSFSTNFGVKPLGGNINYNQGSGSKPDTKWKPNTQQLLALKITNQQQQQLNANNVVPVKVDGIVVPQFMKINFEKNIK